MAFSANKSIVALVTPMSHKAPHTVDYKALGALVEWQLHAGTQAILAGGTTGEGASLSTEELVSVIKICVDATQGRIPVIAGTGTSSTATTIERTLAAANAGADACLVVTPPYVKSSQEGMMLHYKSVCDAAPSMPIILYNVPSRTGCDLSPSTVRKLSLLNSIVGIKEASDDPARILELRSLCPSPFMIYSGNDNQCAYDMLERGADGVISVTANLVPDVMMELCEAAFVKNDAETKRLDEILQPLHKALFIEPSPSPTKFALTEVGRINGGIRAPLLPLSLKHHEAVSKAREDVTRAHQANVNGHTAA